MTFELENEVHISNCGFIFEITVPMRFSGWTLGNCKQFRRAVKNPNALSGLSESGSKDNVFKPAAKHL